MNPSLFYLTVAFDVKCECGKLMMVTKFCFAAITSKFLVWVRWSSDIRFFNSWVNLFKKVIELLHEYYISLYPTRKKKNKYCSRWCQLFLKFASIFTRENHQRSNKILLHSCILHTTVTKEPRSAVIELTCFFHLVENTSEHFDCTIHRAVSSTLKSLSAVKFYLSISCSKISKKNQCLRKRCSSRLS